MIEVRDIVKNWGEVRALQGVSLSVPRGSIAGLVGADGAGKSTLFDIIVTLVRPDSGSVVVDSLESSGSWREVRRKVGYMPARFSLYGDLSVSENLRFFADIYRQPVSNVESIGQIWDQIAPFGDRPAAALSGGMKQKLALCCTMIHNPAVLLLDEPTTGVDPTSRREFWEALRTLADSGRTILVSTSYMDEAARCDHLTMLEQGRVIASIEPSRVASEYIGRLYRLSSMNAAADRNALKEIVQQKLPNVPCYTFGDELHLTLTGYDSPDPEQIAQMLSGEGIDPAQISVTPITPTVEDLFIQRKTQKTEML